MDQKMIAKIEEHIEEKEEREKRKNNIVLVNIPESIKETAKEREAEDMVAVANLLNKITEVQVNDVSNPVRIGKKREGSEKPRLLKITLNSQEKKRTVLKNYHQLNENVRDLNRKIFINNDLTPTQREQEHKLRIELRLRKENGEKNLKIRNGKIISEETSDKQLGHDQRPPRGVDTTPY